MVGTESAADNGENADGVAALLAGGLEEELAVIQGAEAGNGERLGDAELCFGGEFVQVETDGAELGAVARHFDGNEGAGFETGEAVGKGGALDEVEVIALDGEVAARLPRVAESVGLAAGGLELVRTQGAEVGETADDFALLRGGCGVRLAAKETLADGGEALADFLQSRAEELADGGENFLSAAEEAGFGFGGKGLGIDGKGFFGVGKGIVELRFEIELELGKLKRRFERRDLLGVGRRHALKGQGHVHEADLTVDRAGDAGGGGGAVIGPVVGGGKGVSVVGGGKSGVPCRENDGENEKGGDGFCQRGAERKIYGTHGAFSVLEVVEEIVARIRNKSRYLVVFTVSIDTVFRRRYYALFILLFSPGQSAGAGCAPAGGLRLGSFGGKAHLLARATRRRIAPRVYCGAGADAGRGTRWTHGLERGGGPGTVPCGPAGEGAGPGNPARHRRWTGAVGGTERRVGGGGAETAPAQAVDAVRRVRSARPAADTPPAGPKGRGR